MSAVLVLGACATEPEPTTSTTEGKLVAINVAEDWVNHWYYGTAGEHGSNSYVHDDRTYWSDANPDEPGKYSNNADCSGFIDATMKRAYGYTDTQLNSWLCTHTGDCPGGRPLAVAYFNAILDENHFTVKGTPPALAVGDILAVKYTNDVNGNTGHVMFVDSQVMSDGTATFQGVTVYLYKVDVIDSSSTYHGSADIRNTLGNGEGVGRGTMHLVTYADGDLAGYKWSTWSGSEIFINGVTQSTGRKSWIVGGRYDDSLPGGSPPACGLTSVISQSQYDTMFPPTGRAAGYTYTSFINAACAAYPAFGQTGDTTMRKREVAAFLANVAHETSQLTDMEEQGTSPDDYSDCTQPYDCTRDYHGRGPIQLSWNYNYHDASIDLGNSAIFTNPDLLLTDVSVGWKTSLWFWMTSEGSSWGHTPKTGHVAMTATTPDGFIKTIRIINGDLECDVDDVSEEGQERQRRIDFYNSFVGTLGTTAGTMNNALCPVY